MPFPLLSHQAPVLPLALWRPRWFSATALCVGSMAPDFELLRTPARPVARAIGHSVLGQFVFCLPLTLVATHLIARYAGPALATRLPAGTRWQFSRLAAIRDPFSSAQAAAVAATSALIGSFSHVLLDGATHTGSWLARLFPLLDRTVVLLGAHMAVARVLQYAVSLVGAVIALICIDRVLRRPANDALDAAPRLPAGGGVLTALSAVFALLGLIASGPAIARPSDFFDDGRIYVVGYVVFRMVCAAFVGLVLGAMFVDRHRRPLR